MVIRFEDTISLITTLGEEEGIKVTAKGSFKGAIITAFICFAFSLLLGPIGLAIGGSVGGLAAYWISRETFKPLKQVINTDLTSEQKKDLTQKVRTILGSLEASDALELVALVTADEFLKARVLKAVVDFFIQVVKRKIE